RPGGFVADGGGEAAGQALGDNGRAGLATDHAAGVVGDDRVAVDAVALAGVRARGDVVAGQRDADAQRVGVAGRDQAFDQARVRDRAAAHRDAFAERDAVRGRADRIERTDHTGVDEGDQAVHVDAVAVAGDAVADDQAVVGDRGRLFR